MCRGEIIVVGEVLGVSQCLDSVAGGIAVKLVNPAGLGISSAGGVRRSRGLKESVPANSTVLWQHPNTSMLYPSENPPPGAV